MEDAETILCFKGQYNMDCDITSKMHPNKYFSSLISDMGFIDHLI